jgi:hypothetical protein
MLNRRTLFTLAFALCFCSAASPVHAQDFCPEVVGMSVCDPSYPGVWAECVAGDWLREGWATVCES